MNFISRWCVHETPPDCRGRPISISPLKKGGVTFAHKNETFLMTQFERLEFFILLLRFWFSEWSRWTNCDLGGRNWNRDRINHRVPCEQRYGMCRTLHIYGAGTVYTVYYFNFGKVSTIIYYDYVKTIYNYQLLCFRFFKPILYKSVTKTKIFVPNIKRSLKMTTRSNQISWYHS